MPRRLLIRSLTIGLTCLLCVIAIGAVPLLAGSRNDARFAAIGSWAGGVLGGIGLIASILTLFTAVYLASPEKEEHNRLEKSRVRALETLDVLAVATDMTRRAASLPQADRMLTNNMLRHSANQAQSVLNVAVEDGLLRLLVSIDGDTLDPFQGNAESSVSLRMMRLQALLTWITNGADVFTDNALGDLGGLAVSLYESLTAAESEVRRFSGSHHAVISRSLHNRYRPTPVDQEESASVVGGRITSGR